MSALMLFVCGCGDSAEAEQEAKQEAKQELIKNGWYPVNGGYINLHNVRKITSLITNESNGPFERTPGPITEESVRISKDYDGDCGYLKAFIKFDDLKVYLPEARGNKEERDAICDSWLKTMREIEKILTEMKK